jgi:hypothetical protein
VHVAAVPEVGQSLSGYVSDKKCPLFIDGRHAARPDIAIPVDEQCPKRLLAFEIIARRRRQDHLHAVPLGNGFRLGENFFGIGIVGNHGLLGLGNFIGDQVHKSDSRHPVLPEPF